MTELWVQYDGWADWPTRPDPLAIANAVAGQMFVHPTAYLNVDPYDPKNITWTNGNMTYVMVPNANLPIVQPLRWLGLNTLANSVQESMRATIEAAYDRPSTQQQAAAYQATGNRYGTLTSASARSLGLVDSTTQNDPTQAQAKLAAQKSAAIQAGGDSSSPATGLAVDAGQPSSMSSGSSDSGSVGSGSVGSGSAGSQTSGSGSTDSTGYSGSAGSAATNVGSTGSGTAGSGTAGSDTAGSGTAGSGTAGSRTAGSGTADSSGSGSSSGSTGSGDASASSSSGSGSGSSGSGTGSSGSSSSSSSSSSSN